MSEQKKPKSMPEKGKRLDFIELNTNGVPTPKENREAWFVSTELAEQLGNIESHVYIRNYVKEGSMGDYFFYRGAYYVPRKNLEDMKQRIRSIVHYKEKV